MKKGRNNVIPMQKRSLSSRFFKKKQKTKRQKIHDAIMFAFVGGILVLSLVCIGQGIFANYQKQQLEEKISVKSDVLDGEKQAITTLEKQATLLKDEDYVTKVARSKYYLSKDGEIIFSLPEDNESKQAEILNKALLEQKHNKQDTSQGG